ncbi:Replication factor C subunit 3 [Halotydeus destructor]|nr:Replication factor C subunit 3 [Halotydeus destructor]
MSLWCDKYRPSSLNKLDFNKDQAAELKNLVQSSDFPHLLVYGPSGAGKKTRIHCILRELFSSSVDKLRIEHKTFETPSKRKIEVRVVCSNFHTEVNPSDYGIYDRVALLELVKDAANMSVLSTEKASFTVFVITEADKLTQDAQQGLRRTMETARHCRFILTGETSSPIIPAIKSRCLSIRVPSPSIEEIAGVVSTVCRKENFSIDYEEAVNIAKNCDRNLRRALLMAETMKATSSKRILQPQWLSFTQKMADKILKNLTPKGLEEARIDYFELQAHLIPPELIFRHLLDSLIVKLKPAMQMKTIKLAAYFEHKMRLGSKAVIHFEAFVAHFMCALKAYQEGQSGGDVDMKEEHLLTY